MARSDWPGSPPGPPAGASPGGWPDLADLPLAPTMSTLHLWSQVVGKIRLALTPWENHGWHVPLYVTPRGYATGLIPRPGAALAIGFDLVDGALDIAVSDGGARRLPLGPGSMAAFHADLLTALHGLGVGVTIDTMPAEIADARRFDEDVAPRGFDPDVARAYWRASIEVQRVFQRFRSRFVGKCSPIHLFWGAFDLAVTRFSGRVAPAHPGGAPHLPDSVAREAYSREVSSAGFWPNLGGADGPSFYAYAYPVPDGFAAHPVRPAAARHDPSLGEFLLPYAALIAEPDQDAALLDFLQDSYEAAAVPGGWDRALLERAEGALGRPPPGS